MSIRAWNRGSRKVFLLSLLALFVVPLSALLWPASVGVADRADVEYWAVLVGVADYPENTNDLDYTDDDARDVRDALLAGANWEENHIQMLIDADATRANIHQAIATMGANGDADDVFFFFFSGHGTQVSDDDGDEHDNQDEALCQYDYGSMGPITDDELGTWLAGMPSGAAVLVAIDTCFSGGMIKGMGLQAKAAPGARTPSQGDGFARDLDDVLTGVVLTACDEGEHSFENISLQNGVFTNYFIEGLYGPADDEGNSDDTVSMEEAFEYLCPLVATSGFPQNPQMYDNWPGEDPSLGEAPLVIFRVAREPPTVQTSAAASIEPAGGKLTATLNGLLTHDGGGFCQYRFQYGTSPGAYTENTGWKGSVSTGDPFSETVSDLEQDTTYYFRAQARNSVGEASGGELTFNTELFSLTLDADRDEVSLTVDGTLYSAEQLPVQFSWANGSVHQCAAPSILEVDDMTQYVFLQWSDDGHTQPARTITVSADAAYTATYKTQHYLDVRSEYSDPSGEGWYDEGVSAALETVEVVEEDGTRYVFSGWLVDGEEKEDNTLSIAMDTPHTALTTYRTQYYLEVTSEHGDAPSGGGWYDEGTTATTGAAEEYVYDGSSDGTRYKFSNWLMDGSEDQDNPSVSIVMDAPRTAAAQYRTQYHLTVNSPYGDPVGEGWYDDGAVATVSVTSPIGTLVRQVFTGWSGDLSSADSSDTLMIDEPKTVTAEWRNDYLYVYLLVAGILIVLATGALLAMPKHRGKRTRPRTATRR